MSAITYLWIALGGALGSVSRAWLALAATRITGPQFPWGTIAINILGSFIIGFFGTLTTSTGGRFAIPAEMRALVMIGFCGGFTTFSSFSLQTLELARDGRMAQALGNIGLSVALCLASVAIGHYGAAALNPGQVVEGAAQPKPDAAPAVVAVVDRPAAAPGILAAAERLLAPWPEGLIHALAIRPRPPAALLPSEEVATGQRAAADPTRTAESMAALHALFDDWARGAHARGHTVDWTGIEGSPGWVVAARAGRAVAAVLRRPEPHGDDLAHEALHAALFDARCPVLVLPGTPGPESAFGRTIAVAWRNDPYAAAAVTAALPWLRRAERVVVVCGTEGQAAMRPRLPPALARNGIEAQFATVYADAPAMGGGLLQAAHDAGADMLVMGAYGRGELRERVLGGVTRDIITRASLPVLMRH
ncbi:fluoride efflux transporter CrcB [Rhodopila globiformis]